MVERDGRLLAYGAMGCSAFTIVACIVILPMIQNQLSNWSLRVHNQMVEFKALTDDSWNEMMDMRKKLRFERQANPFEFLEELDSKVFAEFGEDHGTAAPPLKNVPTLGRNGEPDPFFDPFPTFEQQKTPFPTLPPRLIFGSQAQNSPPPPSDPRAAIFADPRFAFSRPETFGRAPVGKPAVQQVAKTQTQQRPPQQPRQPLRQPQQSRQLIRRPPPPPRAAFKASESGYGTQPPPAYQPPPPQSYQTAPPPSYKPEPQRMKCGECKRLNCPAGNPGPPGPPGLDGRPGGVGADGQPGLDAPDVAPIVIDPPCISCPPGQPGTPGPPGDQGKPGDKGELGQHGIPGRPGMPGAMGGKGDFGSKGGPGNPGNKGLPGLDLLGGKGVPGPKGPVGAPGLPGSAGEAGKSIRYPGAPGPQGPRGRRGQHGLDGYPGTPGSPGDKGEPGNDANYCQCPEHEMKPYYQADGEEQNPYRRANV